MPWKRRVDGDKRGQRTDINVPRLLVAGKKPPARIDRDTGIGGPDNEL